MNRFTSSIQNKLLLLAMVPAILIAIVLTAYTTNIRIDEISLLSNQKARAIAEQIASENVNNIFTGNKEQVSRNIFRYFNHYSDLYKIQISSTNEIYASDTKPNSPKAQSIYSSADIALQQSDEILDDFGLESSFINDKPTVIGKVELWLFDRAHAKKRAIIQTSFIVLAGIIFAMLVIIFPMSRRLTVPIRELAHAFSRLAEGKHGETVKETSRDEILTLQKGFNNMSSALANQHEKLNDEVARVTRDLNTTLQALEIQNIELDIARKLAVESSRVKSEFLANMSHEIRTPMNGIIGFISLMRKTRLDKEQQDYLSTINQSANNLLQILNDILDYSKLEAGKVEVKNTVFPVEELISHSIHIFSPLAHNKKLNVIPLIFNDVPQTITADRQHLTQVLNNLISNAIKFTEKGEIIIRVAVEECSATSCILTISVSDTGIGISEENIAKLFQPFKQVSSDFSRGYGGTGLGLSISRSLVNMMQGDISIDSTEGEGSTFTVRLPVNIPQMAGSTMEARRFAGKQLHLYDSHRLSRLSLINIFKNMGFSVREYETLTAFENDLPLPDNHLSVISLGADETRLLDENMLTSVSRTPCPVIFLVSTSDQQLLERYSSDYGCAVIKRPAFKNQLTALCTRLLGMEQESGQATETTVDNLDRSLADKSVLIVDDNTINQKLLASILEPTGASITLAVNGQEAIDAFALKLYDLVFMDIHMPKMNGIDATMELRKSGFQVPIIGLTADAAFLEKGVSSMYGFNTILLKPVDMDAVNQILNDFSEGRKIIPSDFTMADEQQVSDTSQLAVRDLQQALRIADNQEEVAEKLFRMLLDQLPEYLDSAHREFAGRNWKALWEVLHKLHGATSVCGVPALNNAIKKLQKLIERENYYAIESALNNLKQEAQKLSAHAGEDA